MVGVGVVHLSFVLCVSVCVFESVMITKNGVCPFIDTLIRPFNNVLLDAKSMLQFSLRCFIVAVYKTVHGSNIDFALSL